MMVAGIPLTDLLRTERVSLGQLRKLTGDRLLYAILDGCDAPAVLEKVQELGPERACSLYRGIKQSDPAIAPYLVKVDAHLLEWIAATMWQQPWGVFLASRVSLDDVHDHLRRFLVVRAPTGEELNFRYYDPRILRTYIATCLDEELLRFFGPIRIFGIPDPQAASIVLFLRRRDSPNLPPPKGPMQLRREQFSAFAAQARAAFVNRVMSYLRQILPDRVGSLSDEQLRAMVSVGLVRGRKHGLTEESSLTGFVGFMLEFAPNFDQHPRIRQLLADRLVSPNSRIDLVAQKATDQDWEEVRRLYDANAWLTPTGKAVDE